MKELLILFAAMVPGTELRLAVPLAFALGMNPAETFFYSAIGNMVPIVLLPVVLEKSTNWLRRYWIFDKLISWLFARVERHSRIITKYGPVGLVLFVAIPMPGTGGWSGCTAAFLMRMRYRTTLVAVSVGMLIAGAVVLVACMGVRLCILNLLFQIASCDAIRYNIAPGVTRTLLPRPSMSSH